MWKNVFKLMAYEMMEEFNLIKAQAGELRGRAREVLLNRFLEPLLPDNIGLGSGVITSVEGKNSGQIDIIIYDKPAYSVFKPFTYYMPREARPFPSEVVYDVIEVENKLTPKTFKECISKIEKVKKMPKEAYYEKLSPFGTDIRAYGKQWKYCPTLGVIFSFDSSKLEDLLLLWKKTNEEKGLNLEHQVDLVCVLKKGLLFHFNPKSGKICFPPDPECQLGYKAHKPEINLTLFYEAIMHRLTQSWTSPIDILKFFGYK